ncbi:MAG: quinone oxidoreductase [Erythrobacter sp.]|nr:quinone oxidoreductase [Erythrobacter sp.]MBA4163053.1 quinone oxidoreductase [Erythrobacter sp.]
MKAAILKQLGPLEPFHLVDLPTRSPGAGEVSIKVRATSINVVDTKIRAGMGDIAPAGDIVLGCDVAGIIEAVGPGVTRFAIGDEVYGCAGGVKGRDGAYREQMITDARLLAKKPTSCTFEQAAALPLVSITAWEALVDRAQVKPGETVLVHGGTGGVGHIGVQLAKALGAIVHTTVSSDEKAQLAKKLGADVTINYRARQVVQYAAEETNGRGYDVVFDTVGSDNIAASLEALAVNGRCVSIVSLHTSPDLSALHMKNARLDLVLMLIPMLTGEGLERHGFILENVARLVDAGRIQPLLDDRVYSLDELILAHDHLASGAAIGKIAVRVS